MEKPAVASEGVPDRASDDTVVMTGGRGGGVDESTNYSTSHPEDGAVKEPQTAVAPATTEDVPPNGGYGWVCVGCVFLINAHTWGINSTYGVFLAHYLTASTFPGSTPLSFAFIGGLSISMSLAIAPLATTLTRLHGTLPTLLLGIALETLALISASFATRIWHLFLSQGLCFGFGMGFLFVASVGIAPQWFTTRRSLANGICAAGSGFGGMTYSLAANAMIGRIGLGWTFRVLGIVACGVNLVCASLVRDRTKAVGAAQMAWDYRLFRRPEFCLVQAWGVFSMLGYIVLLFSLPNYGTSIGLTAHQGSVVNAVLQLGQMLGRPPVGYFSDRFGRINMAMATTFLCGLFCLVIWIFATSYGVLIFFAFICGTVAGSFWATIAPVGAEVVGLKLLPSALSITWTVLVLPTTFSEPMALEIAGRSSVGYLGTQLFAGFMYIAAGLCLVWVKAWKVGELERADAVSEKQGLGNGIDLEIGAVPTSPLIKRVFAWRRV